MPLAYIRQFLEPFSLHVRRPWGLCDFAGEPRCFSGPQPCAEEWLALDPSDLFFVMDRSILSIASKKKRRPESVQSIMSGTRNRCSRRTAVSTTCL